MPRSTCQTLIAALCTFVLALGACREQPSATSADTSKPIASAADSQYSATAMIARFRETVPEHPQTFGSGARSSRDSLVTAFVRAFDTRDTASLAAMRLTVSEFAWLTYLDMPQSKPPYELDPDVLWMQLTSQSDKGLHRALDHLDGKPFGFKGISCQAPETLGTTRIHRCELSGRTLRLPLAIVERDGLFKFTSYANRL